MATPPPVSPLKYSDYVAFAGYATLSIGTAAWAADLSIHGTGGPTLGAVLGTVTGILLYISRTLAARGD